LRRKLSIVYVATDENVPRIAAQAVEVARIARIGELVEFDEGLVLCRQPIQHEIGNDDAGAAANQYQGMSRTHERPASQLLPSAGSLRILTPRNSA
jgi:hypothetical protein